MGTMHSPGWPLASPCAPNGASPDPGIALSMQPRCARGWKAFPRAMILFWFLTSQWDQLVLSLGWKAEQGRAHWPQWVWLSAPLQ